MCVCVYFFMLIIKCTWECVCVLCELFTLISRLFEKKFCIQFFFLFDAFLSDSFYFSSSNLFIILMLMFLFYVFLSFFIIFFLYVFLKRHVLVLLDVHFFVKIIVILSRKKREIKWNEMCYKAINNAIRFTGKSNKLNVCIIVESWWYREMCSYQNKKDVRKTCGIFFCFFLYLINSTLMQHLCV